MKKKILAYFQYFDSVNGEKINRKWRCKCGNFRTRRNSWTNLMEYIMTAYPNNHKELDVGSPGDEIKLFIDFFVAIDAAKAINRNRPLKFVEEAES